MLMDDKLTRKSQEAVSAAVRRAAADGSPQVESLHLLLALLDQADGTTGPLLRAVGADPALIAKQAEERLARMPRARGATLSAPEMSRPLLTVISTAAGRARQSRRRRERRRASTPRPATGRRRGPPGRLAPGPRPPDSGRS